MAASVNQLTAHRHLYPRIEAHEKHCDTREAAAGRAELRADMRAGFDRLEGSVEALGVTLHGRISKLAEARYRLILAIAGLTIVTLIGAAGFLFVRAIGWS